MSLQSRVMNREFFDGWLAKSLLGRGSGGRTAVFRMERQRGFTEVCAMKAVSVIEESGSWEELSDEYRAEFEERMQELQENALHEVELMYRLRGNPTIVGYQDYKLERFREPDCYGCDLYIRMERLVSLRDLQKANTKFSEKEIIRIGKEICQALVTCHSEGIIHRDIKPANIFCNKNGQFKLGDFGVSRILEADRSASTAVGTEHYAPPEQFHSGYDRRVDIYSLGLTLYELANGSRLPFSSKRFTNEMAVRKRLSGKHPLPLPENASPALAAVILKACAYQKEQRYQTAQEMLEALRMAEQGELPAGTALPTQPVPECETDDSAWDDTTGTMTIRKDEIAPENSTERETKRINKVPPEDDTGHETKRIDRVPPEDDTGRETKLLPGGKARKTHRALRRGILAVVILAVAGFAFTRFYHVWTPATCTEPETCSLCGETRGEALGHQWTEATCLKLKTCSVCGETEGELAAHTWKDATCTEPKTCSVCGETEGEPAGHSWKAATHETPKTCSVCGETEGEPRGFIASLDGDWSDSAPLGTDKINGNYLILERPVTKCFRFTLCYSIDEENSGSLGSFVVYGLSLSGEWSRLGTFRQESSGETEAEIELSTPASFTAIYVAPPQGASDDTDVGYWIKDIYTNND